MVSSVRYNFKQSVSASGGSGFELEIFAEKGDSKEILIEIGKNAMEASRELMRMKL